MKKVKKRKKTIAPLSISISQARGCKLAYNPPSPQSVASGQVVTFECDEPFRVEFEDESPFFRKKFSHEAPRGKVNKPKSKHHYKYSVIAFGLFDDPEIIIDLG